ncbi:MAG: hypothetical protein WB820_20375, partial [Rhodoplanes sp.]
MRTQPKGSAALKHGGYSGLTLLPGEDRFAFEKLRRELFAELKPQGRLEQEIVTDIARLIWRKQNLGSYELTQLLRIFADVLITSTRLLSDQKEAEKFVKSAENYKAILEAKDRVKAQEQSASEAETERLLKEHDVYKMATLEGLMRELGVEERLGAKQIEHAGGAERGVTTGLERPSRSEHW